MGFIKYLYFFFNSESPGQRSSFQRSMQPLRKSKKGLNSASYVGQLLWNKLHRSGNKIASNTM